MTQEELNKLYISIRNRAMTDEEYRKELLDNPTKVIEDELGYKLPDGMRFNVVEEDPAYNATFVLPDMLGEEIETEDLYDISGGVSIVVAVSACAAAVGIISCPADACAAKLQIIK